MELKILMPSVLALATMLFCNQPNKSTSCVEQSQDSTHYVTKSYTEQINDSLIENNLNIFRIVTMGGNGNNGNNVEDVKAFVSLSDIYYDSLAIPPKYITQQKKMSFDELKFFELGSEYRKKLLDGTNIHENDTMFLYDYGLNELMKIPVKKLKAVAHLTPYAYEGREIFDGDYMIGFQVDKYIVRKSAANYYNNVLVYIGNENPFTQKQLHLVKWKKISEKDFPKPFPKNDRYEAGNHYKFKKDGITYYVQDILFEKNIERRHFIAVGKNGKNIIAEKYFSNGEGTSLVALNFTEKNDSENQWIGYLFKNKPPVIFGFLSHSFGCPSIVLLDKTYADIPINCDNRH